MMTNITLYAYLDINNPMVAWECAIGRIKSSCDNNKSNFCLSLRSYNLLKQYADEGVENKFLNELKLENVRQLFFPSSVSRLRGVYFFETEKDARIAVERWHKPYMKDHIAAVNFSANHLIRVDSEWITHCLNSSSIDNGWMKSYWNGEVYGDKPLREVLASGIGIVQDYELRMNAYRKIIQLWPDSTPLLASACCSFKKKQMEEVALIKPAIVAENGCVRGGFYIYMNDFDTREEEIADAVKICQQKDICSPIFPPKDKKNIFKIPDMQEYSFEFKSKNCGDLCSKISYKMRFK